ncbi:MAG: hypothetical protein A3I00_05340 [Betaproteobacteria bacterium RIFCSPLOWO2_02_FULL_64_12]|nr:MAG: hypothetical protein A3G76_06245 [Acidobacteria bacterium RIFCSPLOWO2_12_FULL_65_11]OGA01762.1 MAG: hypothetical protein A3I00_05340 [Betaproteobacteria bacterium RIFCSPLOWO2_02_FULL_64_12]
MTAAPLWRERSVLVTGCAGFLGAWLVEALLARESRVVGLVRRATPESRLFWERLAEKVVVVQGDVRDLAPLERVVGEYGIRTVFHLAAQSIVETGREIPVATLESNVQGTWNVLEACRRVGRVEQVLIASSEKASERAGRLVGVEGEVLAGLTPYEASKGAAELIARSYWHTYGLPMAVVRCANLFGGGDLNFTRIVPGTIRAGLRGEPPVIRSDGTPLGDYLYVEDGAMAFLRVAEAMAADPSVSGTVFNFSYDQQTRVLDLVRRILALLGRADLVPVVLNTTRSVVTTTHAGSDDARRRLGWRPAVGMDEAILRTIAWYRRHFGAT